MTDYTTIFFGYGLYSKNKVGLKKIISKFGLKWNASKIKMGISYDEMIGVFKFFQSEDRILSDESLKGRNGSSGVWESGNGGNAIKIFMFDKKDDSEHLPVMLVYKGDEGSFYKEFVGVCVNIGCEVGKLTGDEKELELVFKKRKNVELIEKLDNVEGRKSVAKEAFLVEVLVAKEAGHPYSSSFVKGWMECIDKYGDYSFDDLILEMQKKNEIVRSSDKDEGKDMEVDMEEKSDVVVEDVKIDKVEKIGKRKFVVKRRK